MGEVWRPVLGYEGSYEVSSLGRVRSLERLVPIVRMGRRSAQLRCSKVLRPRPTYQGYLMVALYLDRKRRDRSIHSLVAEAFHGPRPAGMAACHNNDIKSDNRAENLRWDTWSENQLDRVRNGINPNSNKTHCPRGHEYNEANTATYDGSRHCRPCAAINARQRNRKVAA